MTVNYDPKTDSIILDYCDGFDEVDFARLALACLDQAGVSLLTLDRVIVAVAGSLDTTPEHITPLK